MRHPNFLAHGLLIPCFLTCGLLLGALPAAGQTAVPTTVTDDPRQPLALDVPEESFELSLEQTIVFALQHNVSLVVERYRRDQSLLGVREAFGIYDLGLEADLLTSSSTRPPTSTLEEAEVITTDFDRWNFGLAQLTPWGGTASLSFDNSVTESSNQAVQPNPQYSVSLNVGYLQPLLRGFGRQVTERDIVIARTNTAINLETFRAQVESVVQQVTDTYWDLLEAKEQLAVSEESLELAKELHEMNRIQVEVGTMAPLEMVQSEVGVATREEEIIRRRAAVQDAEDSLRRLVNLEQELWDVELMPVTDPEVEHQPIDVAAAVDLASQKRADVIQQRLDNDTRRLDAEVARNSALPRLDLTAGYGYNGVAGDVDFGDVQIQSGWSDALEQVTGQEFDPSWQIQLVFAYPLQNRTARAAAARAELFAEQGDYELRDLLDQVLLDVRRTARAVETAAKAIDSAKVSSKLARKNLEAEQKRYENGLSTSFQVLEIQEDLSQARSREVSAVIGYRKALTAYQLATGQLLDAYDILLETGAEEMAEAADDEG